MKWIENMLEESYKIAERDYSNNVDETKFDEDLQGLVSKYIKIAGKKYFTRVNRKAFFNTLKLLYEAHKYNKLDELNPNNKSKIEELENKTDNNLYENQMLSELLVVGFYTYLEEGNLKKRDYKRILKKSDKFKSILLRGINNINHLEDDLESYYDNKKLPIEYIARTEANISIPKALDHLENIIEEYKST